MIKKYFPIFVAASMITFASCSSDSDDNGGSSTGTISVEDSKESLANTAGKVLDMLNPDDQAEIFEVAAGFSAMYGDLEFPTNFVSAGYASATPEFFAALNNFASGDLTALSRAMSVYTYNIKYSELTGEYEPGTREWSKTANSNNIIFRFKDMNDNQVELTISGSGSNYTYTYSEEDYWDNLREVYNIECPRNVNVTLTRAGKTLVDGSTKTNIDIDNHKFSVDADVTAANIRAIASTSGNDSKVTESSEVRIDGKSVINTSATLNGSHLCDIDYLENASEYYDEDEDYFDITSIFKSATAEASLLDEIRISAEGKLTTNLIQTVDYGYWDSYDYDTKAEALADCKKACDEINKNMNCYIKFGNDGKAPLVAEPDLWESKWDSEWEYTIGFVVKFSDGSAVSVDDYFGHGFDSLARRYEAVISDYRRAWGI